MQTHQSASDLLQLSRHISAGESEHETSNEQLDSTLHSAQYMQYDCIELHNNPLTIHYLVQLVASSAVQLPAAIAAVCVLLTAETVVGR